MFHNLVTRMVDLAGKMHCSRLNNVLPNRRESELLHHARRDRSPPSLLVFLFAENEQMTRWMSVSGRNHYSNCQFKKSFLVVFPRSGELVLCQIRILFVLHSRSGPIPCCVMKERKRNQCCPPHRRRTIRDLKLPTINYHPQPTWSTWTMRPSGTSQSLLSTSKPRFYRELR